MPKLKLDPEKEKWNRIVEEQYKRNKLLEKQKSKEELIELPMLEDKSTFKNKQLKAYDKLKKNFNVVNDNETIAKWKILSKAYKLGKDIYGQHFTIVKLSYDFQIPYATAKRVLSLDRANKRTWELINSGEISAFKVAQICMNKSIKFQDQIVDIVIEQNLSTYQIRDLRIKEGGLDVKTVRLEKAVQQGFTRKETAFKSLKDTVKRMIRLLDIPADGFSDKKIPEIIKMLEELQFKTNKKIQSLAANEK